jgi:hypothetical protein
MKLLMKLSSLYVVAASMAVSCGKDSKRSNAETVDAASTANSEEQTGAQLQEASEAIEAIESASTGAGATGTTDDPTEPVRTCTVSTTGDGAVTVAETLKYDVEKSVEGGKLTRKTQTIVDSTRQRVWTPAAGAAALTCSAVKTVGVNWTDTAQVNGLKLVSTIDDSATISTDLTGTSRKGETVTLKLERKRTAKGTRTVTHSDHAAADTAFSFVRTVESSFERTVSGTRKTPGSKTSTESFSIALTNSTAANAPLKIKTEISKTEKTWTSKTIQSGTFVSKSTAKKQRVESTFTNVVFNSGECTPVSGTIAGKVFEVDAAADATPLTTFVLTFGADTDSGVTIAYDGKTAEDFPTAADYLQSCSFGKGWKAFTRAK